MDQADLDRLLTLLAQLDGSDLHIKAGAPPRMRVEGTLRTLSSEPRFGTSDTAAIAESIMAPHIAGAFAGHHEVDFAYSVPEVGRFRANAYLQQGTTAMVFRRVRPHPGTAEELGLPAVVTQLADEARGLVLVTGPTGCGKTTTLASMIDHINRTRAAHIVTIEDPIEYLHADQKSTVDQREVGFDTASFETAMRNVLRQDPDVILVGEMRDAETAHAALTAATTGHLVLSTLPTNNAIETIHRVLDFFPPHHQRQVRISLAGALQGIVAQRLVRRADGVKRVPALEIMVVNGRIRQSIIEPEQTAEIETRHRRRGVLRHADVRPEPGPPAARGSHHRARGAPGFVEPPRPADHAGAARTGDDGRPRLAESEPVRSGRHPGPSPRPPGVLNTGRPAPGRPGRPRMGPVG